jgi:hypothetical protein
LADPNFHAARTAASEGLDLSAPTLNNRVGIYDANGSIADGYRGGDFHASLLYPDS